MSRVAPAEVFSRRRLTVSGVVQGVGFRPFVHRLASELGLAGWVSNTAQGATLEIEGAAEELAAFERRLGCEAPPVARIVRVETRTLEPAGLPGFEIRESDATGPKRALPLPDIAVCPDCRREVFDPRDRRHLYPFASCAHCGPRFTILEGLPYDRSRTTMDAFPMCGRCRAEYENPGDRRFHAQTIACPDCGPRLAAWDPAGAVVAGGHDALLAAARALRGGRIVAVKGLGGFFLACDATNDAAVRRLRAGKRRAEKPFALLAATLGEARRHAHVSEPEAALLASPEGPIVLLARREESPIAPMVAPGLATLGIMLPCTPLHDLLAAETGIPLVATSGNISEEPLCTSEREALERLGGVADLFLVHDRAIANAVDDSVARVVLGRPLVLRSARGYAPAAVDLARELPPTLAVGAHMKNAVAVTSGRQAILGPHVGTLETTRSIEAFRVSIASLEGIHELSPRRAACDAHPDYASTRLAETLGLPLCRVQHHHAHVLACMAENRLDGAVLGVAWDGSGWGPDGTVWGGEFLRVEGSDFERFAHLRTFPLPGGERAVREPRRAALGLLHEILGPALFEEVGLPPVEAFRPGQLPALAAMLRAGICSPRTSSAGRLFDAVASLMGLRQRCDYEGQAAACLEELAAREEPRAAYEFPLRGETLDWEPLVLALIADARRGRSPAAIASAFHESLAAGIVRVARAHGLLRVVLAGGCFQNRRLLERTVAGLSASGFLPYWSRRIPPNDGGIALGQIVAATAGGGEGG